MIGCPKCHSLIQGWHHPGCPEDKSAPAESVPINNTYYWVRHPEGSHFIAKYENWHWWVVGLSNAVDVDKGQIICPVQPIRN